MGCDYIPYINNISQFPLKFRNSFVEGFLAKNVKLTSEASSWNELVYLLNCLFKLV